MADAQTVKMQSLLMQMLINKKQNEAAGVRAREAAQFKSQQDMEKTSASQAFQAQGQMFNYIVDQSKSGNEIPVEMLQSLQGTPYEPMLGGLTSGATRAMQRAQIVTSTGEPGPFSQSQADLILSGDAGGAIARQNASDLLKDNPGLRSEYDRAVNNAMTSRRQAIRDEERGVTLQERKESRTRGAKSVATREGAWRSGVLSGTPEQRDRMRTEQFNALEQVHGTSGALDIMARGAVLADGEHVSQTMRMKGAEGPSGKERLYDSLERIIAGTHTDRDEIRAIDNGSAIYDPAANNELTLTRGGDPKKMYAQRYALRELLVRGEFLEEAWNDAEANADWRVGRVVGSKKIQEWQRLLGMENPKAAYYSTQMKEFISILLKARQGSRPSDFDLQMYMSLVPSLTEVNAGSAQERLRAMKTSLLIAQYSDKDPVLRREVEKIRNRTKTPTERKMDAVALRMEQMDPESDEYYKAYGKFLHLHDKFISQGGGDLFKGVAPAGALDGGKSEALQLTPDELKRWNDVRQ